MIMSAAAMPRRLAGISATKPSPPACERQVTPSASRARGSRCREAGGRMRRRQGGDTAYLVSACEGGMCTHLHARRKSTPAFRETTQGSMSLLSGLVPRPVTTHPQSLRRWRVSSGSSCCHTSGTHPRTNRCIAGAMTHASWAPQTRASQTRGASMRAQRRTLDHDHDPCAVYAP